MEARLLPEVPEELLDDHFLSLRVVFQRIQEQSKQLLLGGVGVFIHQGLNEVIWSITAFSESR
jgi:hypothetical protein